jgi:membrane protein implicated in regulation of membrane protease activity
MKPAFSRALTIVAAAVLAFDGAALAAFGWWSGRVMLVLVGVAFFLSSGLLLVYWRWYRRRLDDIASTRRVLAEEAREMQRLIREK